jgi:hypothetical protein
MAKDSGIGTIIGLGIAGVGVWFLGDMLGWWGGTAAATTAPATTTATGTTAGSTLNTPSGSPIAPTTIPVATFEIVGTAKADINGSVEANVSINGGAAESIAIIISSTQAYNSAGKNITSTLTSQGVNVPALLSAMLASCGSACKTTGVSGLGQFRPFRAGKNYRPRGAAYG